MEERLNILTDKMHIGSSLFQADQTACPRSQDGRPPSSLRPTPQQAPGSQLFQALRQAKLHKNPKVLGVGFLWLFGLFAVFLSPAPVRITDQKMEKFEQRLKILADTDAPRQKAEQRWLEAELEVRNAKVRSKNVIFCFLCILHGGLPAGIFIMP